MLLTSIVLYGSYRVHVNYHNNNVAGNSSFHWVTAE